MEAYLKFGTGSKLSHLSRSKNKNILLKYTNILVLLSQKYHANVNFGNAKGLETLKMFSSIQLKNIFTVIMAESQNEVICYILTTIKIHFWTMVNVKELGKYS